MIDQREIKSTRIWTSHHLFINTTPRPETAWHDNFPLQTIEWQGRGSPSTDQRCTCSVVASLGTHCHSASLPTCDMAGWAPRKLPCAHSIPIPHLIKCKDPWIRDGKKKAFRVILEEPGRATLRPPVLKHKKGRERVGRWIFHLPFFWVWVQQFTPEKAVWIKLRWWAFGCHGNYSAVCSRLMLL